MVIPVPLESIPRGELIEGQKYDSLIKAFFELASPVGDMETATRGYFVKNNVLMCKWCPQTDHFVGRPVLQIAVPAKFREMVIKASHHDVAGHMEVHASFCLALVEKGCICFHQDVPYLAVDG